MSKNTMKGFWGQKSKEEERLEKIKSKKKTAFSQSELKPSLPASKLDGKEDAGSKA